MIYLKIEGPIPFINIPKGFCNINHRVKLIESYLGTVHTTPKQKFTDYKTIPEFIEYFTPKQKERSRVTAVGVQYLIPCKTSPISLVKRCEDFADSIIGWQLGFKTKIGTLYVRAKRKTKNLPTPCLEFTFIMDNLDMFELDIYPTYLSSPLFWQEFHHFVTDTIMTIPTHKSPDLEELIAEVVMGVMDKTPIVTSPSTSRS